MAGGGAAAGRRQGPDAERVVLAILGVGVEVGTGVQHQARPLGGLDHIALGYVAVARVGDHRPGIGAVFLHRQHAARLQRRRETGEIAIHRARRPHPVVDIPRGQDQVDRGGRPGQAVLRAEVRIADRAIDRVVGDLGVESRARLAGAVRQVWIARVGQAGGDVVTAGPGGVGRQDLGPVAARGIDLQHGQAGLEAPEGQAFQGVAPGVAHGVGGRALGTADDPDQGLVLGEAGRRRVRRLAQLLILRLGRQWSRQRGGEDGGQGQGAEGGNRAVGHDGCLTTQAGPGQDTRPS